MLVIIIFGTLLYAGAWAGAVAAAVLGVWQAALPLTAAAGLGWLAAAGATAAWIAATPPAKRSLLTTGAALAVGLFTGAHWFVALNATIQAHDPDAYTGSLPPGFLRAYFTAVDTVIGPGLGAALPASTVAGVAAVVEMLVLWPTGVAAILVLLSERRR